MSRIRVAIHGAAGRMGQRLVALGIADPDLTIAAALEAPHHPRLGQDAGTIAGVGQINVPVVATLDAPVDVVIDFSVPAGAQAIMATCMERGIPLVVATTGLSDARQQMLREAAGRIPLLWSPNMSLAVNLSMKLAEIAAQALAGHPSGADVEIIERHHRFKEDAPSGTALKFGRIIADAMGQKSHRHGREGQVGKRPHGEIGYHAVRIGDNPGEHTVIFGLLGETIELTVRATSRDCYAHGALTAAKFLVGKPPGLYGMADVLKL
ncbi:MAG TPA: 4-hydroxy-tetrahydrodipicolinate reductase [Pirellulales bacterium]|nr:4-hydroxy-tetrahydrodipicolinate reductase [Pirellulales bacterium]